jgi:hypothetical protein
MSVAGRTRRGPTVTSYHVRLSDGQESTVIADAAQRRSAAERSTITTAARRPTSPMRAACEAPNPSAPLRRKVTPRRAFCSPRNVRRL